MTKFLANVFVLTVLVGTQIAVMIYGWGLTPRSWWWIIGVGYFGNIFLHFVVDRLKKESS